MFGLVHYKEVEELNSFINSIKDKNTVDQLQLGPYRDFYADKFFPYISTVMSRAAYYFLVPDACKKLEKELKKTPMKRFEAKQRLREIQKKQALDMIKRYKKTHPKLDNSGIMGWETLRSNNNTKFIERTPFDIYWRSIRELGIAKTEDGTTEYVRKVVSNGYENEKIAAKTFFINDIWRDSSKFLSHLETIELNGDQAQALYDLFTTHSDTKNSLIGSILKYAKEQKIHKIDKAKDKSDDRELYGFIDQAEEELQPYVLNSEYLSALIHLANIYYGLEVFNKWKDENEGTSEFEEFNNQCNWHRDQLNDQDLIDKALEFSFELDKNEDKYYEARQFLKTFQSEIRKGLFKDKDIAESFRPILIQRELSIKHGGARLTHKKARAKWKPGQGTGKPDFRWSYARTIINDILDGLGRKQL